MDQKIALKIPPVLATLGRVVEVNGTTVRYKFTKKQDVELLSTPDGKTLYCLAVKKKETTYDYFLELWQKRRKSAEEGVKLYEKWNDYDVQAGSIVTPPRGFMFRVDRCESIVYESDKLGGEKQKWKHDFKHPPLLWVNKKKSAPTVLKLSGGKIRTTARGITG